MLKLRYYEENPLIYNHFEQTRAIGTKSGLVRSLRQYYYTNRDAMIQGYSEFDTTPTTFVVQSKIQDN